MYYDGKNGYIVNEDGSITKFSSIITPKQNADSMPAVKRGDISAAIGANRPPELYDLAYAMYTGESDKLNGTKEPSPITTQTLISLEANMMNGQKLSQEEAKQNKSFAQEALKDMLKRIQSGRQLTPTEELASTIRATRQNGRPEKQSALE